MNKGTVEQGTVEQGTVEQGTVERDGRHPELAQRAKGPKHGLGPFGASRLRVTSGACAMLLAVSPAAAQTVAITNATVYPVSSAKLTNATVLLRDGKIVGVGTNVTVPANATRIDGTGKVVTPGLIHSTTALGLGVGVSLMDASDNDEYTAIGGTSDTEQEGQINAAYSVRDAIDPLAVAIPVVRIAGVTTAISAPTGGLIAGQGVVIDLDGATADEMLIKAPALFSLDLSADSRAAGGGTRAGAFQRLRRLLEDARTYDRRRADFEQNRVQPLGASQADLEALLVLLKGEGVAFVNANRMADIQNALRLAKDFNLKMILRGGAEAWKVADALAAAKVPVVLDSRENIPSFDGLGRRYDNATILRKAGVTVVLAGDDEGGAGNLRFGAGHAVRNELSWDDALAAVTLEPARVFGIADRYGSLEAGKMANVVVWSGDPFEPSTAVEHVFIRGRDIPLVSRMTELRDRYRTLPPRY